MSSLFMIVWYKCNNSNYVVSSIQFLSHPCMTLITPIFPFPFHYLYNRTHMFRNLLSKYLHVLVRAAGLGNINVLNTIDLLLCHAHLSSEGRVRYPLSTGHGGGLLQHAIDLLESKALGLRDEEVGVDEAENAERAPQEENLSTQVNTTTSSGGNVWGHDCDDLVIVSLCFMIRLERREKPTQFHNQLEAVERPTPRDRMGMGKISPMMTQAPGPQVVAKKAM
jgi:hypothetical protein